MRGLAIRSALIAIAFLLIGMGQVTQADGPVTSSSSGSSNIFADVPAGHWSLDSLKFLLERGVIEGLPNGQFQGDRAATRFEMAAMLQRAINYVENLKMQAATGNAQISSIKPEDLDVLRDLIFNVADKLQQLGTDVTALKSARPEIDPNLVTRINTLEDQKDAVSELQAKNDQLEQTVRDLKNQFTQYQIKDTSVSEEDIAKTNQQILANRIIALFALGAAVVGIGLMTLK